MPPPKDAPESQPAAQTHKAKHKERNYNLTPTPADAEDILRRVSSMHGSSMKSAEGAASLKKELEWLEAGSKAVGGPLGKIGDGKFLKMALELAKLLLAQYLSEEKPA